ncbi:MAG TPA: phosphopyruvate hydratase [archaeon]|nr:phosphopyruvate hydratase [archaeon]
MALIEKINARMVFDSRGNPTVEAEVHTKKGFSRAIVPSGASTGSHEALELRDKEKAFHGKGVSKALSNVKKIELKIKGMKVEKQKELDKAMLELDGTKNKSVLGANSILAVSMACARRTAEEKKLNLFEFIGRLSKTKEFSLPVPFSNVINGGEHAGNNLDIQEFMLVPLKAKTFFEAAQMLSETYHSLKKILLNKYGKLAVNVGDEGGFAPPLQSTEETIELILKAVQETGYEKEISLALDCAATEFFKENKYSVDGKNFSGNELIDFYNALMKKYPIASIEDPFAEDDWLAWKEFTKKAKTQIVGDDLLATNTERIKKAVSMKACNSLLLKVNQIGSLTEAIQAAQLAVKKKWNVIVSHRSGETEDTFIADLSVGLNSKQIKLGAPCRGERTAKFNQLLRIEETGLKYAGEKALKS